MIAIPQWLKTSADAQQHQFHGDREQPARVSRDRIAETTQGLNAQEDGIPIFCAGGCGEVVGYLLQEDDAATNRGRGYEHWCPACEANDLSRKRLAESKIALTSADELAELVKPAPDLRWLRFVQTAAVAVIITGSVCIERGRVVGIYLAGFGTLAWFATYLVLRKLNH